MNVKENLLFDHYNYLQKDLDKIKNLAQSNNLKIVTTEKDFLRISQKIRKNRFFENKSQNW